MKTYKSYISIAGIFLVLSTSSMAGSKSNDAYFVKVDSETTTQNRSKEDPRKKQATAKNKTGQSSKNTEKKFVRSSEGKLGNKKRNATPKKHSKKKVGKPGEANKGGNPQRSGYDLTTATPL